MYGLYTFRLIFVHIVPWNVLMLFLIYIYIFAYIRACTNSVLLQNTKCVQNMKNNGTLSQMKGCIVGFDHGGSHLWAAPDCEGNFALFSIVHRQALQHQATKAGSSATTASVVHTEALQSWDSLTNGNAPWLWVAWQSWPITKWSNFIQL